MRLLVVGDYHAEPSDLDDCQALADLIVDTAAAHGATVLFTGDQYHTHAIIHAEVQLFWLSLYQRLKDKGVESVSLEGNHDRPGSSHSRASSMLAHSHHTHVIREPYRLISWLFVPYMDDAEAFVEVCQRYPSVHTLICHQTFNGSKYENGMYAKDGVDPNLIPQKQVISGHIHAPQEFDKVWYVGAPRWRTLSDANTDRAIWLVDFNMDGSIASKTPFDTGTVCRQIYKLEDREEGGEPLPKHLDPRHEWRVDIYGTAEYIEQRSRVLKAMGCRVRTFKTELEQPKVKESEGIGPAFTKWVDNFQPQHGTDKEVLKGLIEERVKNV